MSSSMNPESWHPDLLAPLFEERVQHGFLAVEDRLAALPREEQALVERAVDTRRQEFSSGRFLARQLLREMGRSTAPILRDEDRVPIWPAQVVGSISHCRAVAVVALAAADDFFGLGVDVEPDEAVKAGVERVVCTEAERAWLDATATGETPDERGRRVKLVFSIKEAVYKAFYPRVRVFWSFQDVALSLDESGGTFEATLPESAGRRSVTGRFLRVGGVIVSAVAAR